MRAATMRKRMLRRLADFRAGRGLRPTERQRELYEALMGGRDPRLTLLGYGGAMGGGKTRAIAELAHAAHPPAPSAQPQRWFVAGLHLRHFPSPPLRGEMP